jgi:hypothetical protein
MGRIRTGCGEASEEEQRDSSTGSSGAQDSRAPRAGLLPNMTSFEDVSQEIPQGFFNLLDHTIGEYDLETKNGEVDFKAVSEHPKMRNH